MIPSCSVSARLYAYRHADSHGLVTLRRLTKIVHGPLRSALLMGPEACRTGVFEQRHVPPPYVDRKAEGARQVFTGALQTGAVP